MKRRVLIVVQNLPVPIDRRVWLERQALVSAGYRVAVVCPRGKGDPGYEVIDGVELHKYRPYAPGGSKLSFIAEYTYIGSGDCWSITVRFKLTESNVADVVQTTWMRRVPFKLPDPDDSMSRLTSGPDSAGV